MTAPKKVGPIALHKAGLSVVPGMVDDNGSKRPAVAWKPYQSDRPSLQQVRAWRDAGHAQWGFITGQVSGRVTLDFDGEEGKRTLESLRLKPHRQTVNNGYHVDVALPRGVLLKTAVKFAPDVFPGLDLKGEGGYVAVIAPGRKQMVPLAETIAWEDLPPELRDALPLRGEPSRNGVVELTPQDRIPNGSRNAMLFDIARTIRGRGLTERGNKAVRRAALAAINEELCDPPLPDSEVVATADSAGKYLASDKWPHPIGDNAYHGIVGEWLGVVAPETEAHPAALLVNFLVAFGNALGPDVGFRVGATRHGTNLFACIVGKTGSARKGTSWNDSVRAVQLADPTWKDCVQHGLSTGEGLIYHVRDSTIAQDDEGNLIDRHDGALEKRLLAFESEFASPLMTMRRDGNTLSPVIRAAWDGSKLSTLTKNSPLRATGAHVSIVGNITDRELRSSLSSRDMANGFANRFLWVAAERSQLLPEGGNLTDDVLMPLALRLRNAMEKAQPSAGGFREYRRDKSAGRLWNERVYPRLTAERPGLVGAITGRAEAQVMRLAVLYAVLDGDDRVRVDHLRAAMAVWRYCQQSADYIFGRSEGDSDADKIVAALAGAGSKGMTTNEIQDGIFHRHRRERVVEKLKTLRDEGRIQSKRVKTAGRPATRWWVS
jgi:hypothetical protein